MSVSIHVTVNPGLSIRDPQETKLGRQLLKESILLIDEIGLEAFTFRKLAERAGTAEASVYRYFENKHKILLYLLCWYWEWMKFMIEFYTNQINNPAEKIRTAIKLISDARNLHAPAEYVDRVALFNIVIAEGTKAYHIKEIDEENKEGFFLTFKALNKTIANLISEYNPNFPYPRALAINILEMVNHHIYFAQHLPSLTDVSGGNNETEEVIKLLEYFTFQLLDKKNKK